jgi:hypothetical protein
MGDGSLAAARRLRSLPLFADNIGCELTQGTPTARSPGASAGRFVSGAAMLNCLEDSVVGSLNLQAWV